ncbi:MAG: hypothetical protein ACI9VR_000016 [Cognaticolwellia sp.]
MQVRIANPPRKGGPATRGETWVSLSQGVQCCRQATSQGGPRSPPQKHSGRRRDRNTAAKAARRRRRRDRNTAAKAARRRRGRDRNTAAKAARRRRRRDRNTAAKAARRRRRRDRNTEKPPPGTIPSEGFLSQRALWEPVSRFSGHRIAADTGEFRCRYPRPLFLGTQSPC